MPNPLASIIICTRNRAESLRETLQAMSLLQLPDGGSCELLVLDNASTDHTAEAAKCCSVPGLTVRYVREARAGKCHAYNTAVAEAAGAILLSTDDDVRPEPGWLLHHLRCYDKSNVAGVQGRIKLRFESPPPPWFERVHYGLLAQVDEGEDFIFPYSGHLVGANMSFRKEAALEVGGFNPLLGPGKAGLWDDSEFSSRLMRAGYLQCYQPLAQVDHIVPASRLAPRYFRDAAIRQGISRFIAAHYGALDLHPHPYRFLARSLLRRCKWELRHWLHHTRPVCSYVEIVGWIELAEMWARLQGINLLAKRLGETLPPLYSGPAATTTIPTGQT